MHQAPEDKKTAPQGSPHAPQADKAFRRRCSCTHRQVKCRDRQYTTPKLYLHTSKKYTTKRFDRKNYTGSLALFAVYFIHGVQSSLCMGCGYQLGINMAQNDSDFTAKIQGQHTYKTKRSLTNLTPNFQHQNKCHSSSQIQC
jgi:hypothetical protein